MRKLFLEKSYTKCGGETIPRFFSKISKLSISLEQQSKVRYCMPSSGLSKYTETKPQTLAFTSYKPF